MKNILQKSILATFVAFSLSANAQSLFDAKAPKNYQPLQENFSPNFTEEGMAHWNKLITNKAANQRKFDAFDVNKLKPIKVNKAIQNSWKVEIAADGLTYFAYPPAQNVTIDFSNDRKVEQNVFQFLETNSDILNLKNAKEEFEIREIRTDKNGNKHIRLDQTFQNLKVYASDIVIHIKENGVYCVNGRYNKTANLQSIVPQIEMETASNLVKEDLSSFTKVIDYPNNPIIKHLVAHPTPESELQIYFDNNKTAHLVWMIEFSPNIYEHWHYIIDANSGEILEKQNNVCHLGPETTTATDLYGTSRTLNTWREGSTYYFVDGSKPSFNLSQSTMPDEPEGAIVTLDLQNNPVDQSGSWVNSLEHIQSNNNNFNNPTAVSAHYNGSKCYDYFKNTHNRNGIDGSNGTIWSVINVSDDNGNNFDNAFWNGTAMFYGNGNQVFQQLPKALDVAAHEMSHGVTQNSANLVYQGQSGALNESFSDVFGAMVDRDDWKMGEDITNSQFISSGALRDLQFPNNGQSSNGQGWQPKSMSEYVNTTQDNGGVHINSGIPNRAFYLFATAVGKETAEDVYYHALTNYLTQNSQFVDCRASVLQACADLFDASVGSAAATAFDQVGIFGQGVVGGSSGGNSATSGGDLPAISGTEFMVVADYSAASGADEIHYKISFNPFAIVSQVTSTTTNDEAVPKVSVTDDGTTAAFVGEDNHIYLSDLTATSSGSYYPINNITPISNYANWRKVAISRDGDFIAALTTANNNEVIVVNRNNGTEHTYTLTNPSTSSDGASGGAPDYADAIQFTHSGEYLMYDARNTINATGNPVVVWDIGLIKVRNLSDDSFGDGTIQKPFPPQPSNISVGNPSFANNSPYVICYDFLDANTGQEFVAAANLETGESKIIVETNGVIGYPTYSPQDDAIAYSDLDGVDYEVNLVEVSSDKITATSYAINMLTEAAWPVWYTQGVRNWQTPTAEFTSNVVGGPAKLTVNFEDISTNSPTQWSWVFEDGNPATSDQTNPVITFDNPGTYKVTLTASNAAGSDTEEKTNYITVGMAAGIEDIIESEYYLSANPNPTNGITNIQFNLPNREKIDLVLYDITGKTIKTLIENEQLAGINEITLDGSSLEKGIYFARIITETKSISHKIVIQ